MDEIDPRAICCIGNVQRIIIQNSSTYPDEGSALYELIKNIKEQPNVKFITTAMHYKTKEAVIYGECAGIDHNRMLQIIKEISNSKKDAHHGIGLYAFFKYASRLLFFSRKNGIFYVMSLVPHPDGARIYSDVGVPHALDAEELFRYSKYCNLLHKDGTIYVVEEIGVPGVSKTSIASIFDMKQVFSRNNYIKLLHEKCNYELKTIRFYVEDDDAVSEHTRIPAKTGHGKNYCFTIPSTRCPFAFPKSGTIFEYPNLPGTKFQLSMEVDIWIGVNNNNGRVYLTEDHQNGRTIDEIFGNSQKVNRSSIFRNNPLGRFLEGEISFSIFSPEGIHRESVYTSARSNLSVMNQFGDVLANMINHLEYDLFRDLCRELEEKQVNRSDQKLNRKYEELLSELIRYNPGRFPFLSKNAGPVIGRSTTRKCKMCNKECEVITNGMDIPDKKINILLLRGSMYHCCWCGEDWKKEERHIYTEGPAGPTSGLSSPSIYSPPDPEKSKERERRRGLGYNVQFIPFQPVKVNVRSDFAAPSLIKINTKHPEYIKLKSAASSKKIQALDFRNMNLMFTEIVNHSEMDPHKRLLYKDEMFFAFTEFTVQKKEKDEPIVS